MRESVFGGFLGLDQAVESPGDDLDLVANKTEKFLDDLHSKIKDLFQEFFLFGISSHDTLAIGIKLNPFEQPAQGQATENPKVFKTRLFLFLYTMIGHLLPEM